MNSCEPHLRMNNPTHNSGGFSHITNYRNPAILVMFLLGIILSADGVRSAGPDASRSYPAKLSARLNPRAMSANFPVGTWTSGGSMANARVDHDAVLLQNGKVIVVGGGSGSQSEV